VLPAATTGNGRIAPQEITFGSANGPAFRKQVQPVYPSLARRRGKEGVVLLRISISETGQLTRLEVLEDPGYGFAEAAQEAVRGSSFTPAHHNGKPVAVLATLPIRFNLR
jgi:protein TonB